MPSQKILFIVVPNFKLIDKSNVINYRPPFLIPPYGVLSIASYVREYVSKPLEIEVLDLNTVTYANSQLECSLNEIYSLTREEITESIINKVNAFKPDLIVCSLLFNSGYEYVETVSAAIETIKGDSVVIFGGKVPTNHYKEFLKEFSVIDAICVGEGEVPFLKLLEHNNWREFIEEDCSFITREGVRNSKIPQSQFVNQLDEIPVFAFDLIDMDKYLSKYVSSLRSIEAKMIETINGLEVISTRGCPFSCIFCTSNAVHGKKIRYRSPESIISEVLYLKKKYNLNLISFQDDNFFHNRKRAIEILDRLIELDLGIMYEFANGIAIYCVDEELASRLEKLKLSDITISVESGSPYMLNKVILKPLKVEMVKPAVEILRKYNIRVFASFVFGIPGETDADRELTLKLIEDVGFDWVHLFAAIPFSGSRLYDVCIDNNYIQSDTSVITSSTKYSSGIINTETFTAEFINKFVYTSNLHYNFINNYNYKKGNYQLSIMYFKKVLQDFTDHAFAHYMIYKSYTAINDHDSAKIYRDNYLSILSKNEFWADYANYFELQV